MIDLRKTIVPKSDQLNADDLVGGEMTIKVTKVEIKDSADQPIFIYYEGGEGKPYKPCKTMRRLLVKVWGYDGEQYAGRSMTLYLDDSVKWAGVAVGGIRISHVSHIEKPTDVLLTVAKGKRRPYTVQPLKVEEQKPKELPRLTDDEFNRSVEAIKNGKTTVAELLKKRTLTLEETSALREVEEVVNNQNQNNEEAN